MCAFFALFFLKAMFTIWKVLEETMDDIKSLRQKKLLPEKEKQGEVLGSEILPTGNFGRPLNKDEIQKIQMVEHFLKEKSKNKPSN